jgi:MEMO1 family protein
MRIFIITLVFLISCGGSSPAQDGISACNFRPTAAAGTFYPADPGVLSAMIDSLLDLSETALQDGNIIAGIVPHAGYVYSGVAAAEFYRSIEDADYDVVVLIGPSHRVAFEGFSIYSGAGYTTPLGEVTVATDITDRLIRSHPSASYVPEAHASEHCLEVQLPFLQRVLEPGFSIVPIVVGSCGMDELRYMAELLFAEAAGQRILVIASSDLSHYPPLELAEYTDSVTVESILEGNGERFLALTSPDRLPDGLDTFACGRLPIALILFYSELYPDVSSELLALTTSADYSGDGSEVVGYASIRFTSSLTDPSEWTIPSAEQEILLDIAVSSISSAVRGSSFSLPESLPAELNVPRGAFVTLKIDGQLRGCIGSIRPIAPLSETVAEMARNAAMEDPRFQPVTEREMMELEFEISVLTPMQILDDWRLTEVGNDGLVIIGPGGRSGVLLPQVPIEQGWNRVEYLEGLCRKAGLDENTYLGEVILYRFQAQVFGRDEKTLQE